MSMFTANYSSSTASTPLQASKQRNYARNITPQASTTPLVPPPSQPFASSYYGSGVSKLRFNDTQTKGSAKTFNVSSMTQDDDDSYIDRNYNTLPPPNHDKSLMRFSSDEPLQTLSNSSRRSTSRRNQHSLLPSKGVESSVPGLARDYKLRSRPAKLETDPDSIIVQTEELLQAVHEDIQTADNSAFNRILSDTGKELEKIWEGPGTDRRRRKDEDLSIGPGPGATPFENARFVAILILRLHNASRLSRDDEGAMSMPQILLDWLNEYHMTIEGAYTHVTSMEQNCTATVWFWEVVELLAVRGKFQETMNLLEKADFSYAKIEDDSAEAGIDADYNGQQLQAIQTAVFQLRQMLNACPAVQSNDWYINGPEWMAYRSDIEGALETLRDSALTQDESLLSEDEADFYYGRDLPFEVFQRIQNVYNILLGSTDYIKSLSQDWLEASTLLTVWWSSNLDTKVREWSFDVNRAHHPAQSNTLGPSAYLSRLKDAFLYVTDPASKESSPLNAQSALELALGLTLQGELCSAVALIQTYSLCISSTLAEIGSWSGWLNSTSLPAGLGREDLMVLTNGASNALITKDDALELYSHQLFERPDLGDDTLIYGWEIAISVISRCENKALASRTVQSYIEELAVTTGDRASRLMTLCSELGMAEEARRVSEQFGDHLVNTSSEYGTALLCYAKGHAEEKVRKLIELLCSYCLVQSRAYPSETETDHALLRLVSDPKQALDDMAETEPQAVETLQFYLVGYACLRRYYTTRDAITDTSLVARKKTAAKALVAVINSAADSIYGGLYDPSRQSAIQVDGLLTLLGEATALLVSNNNGQRILTSAQLYSILAAIEDLQTVSDRVYAATEECLAASLRQARGSLPPSPHAMLKKSISSGTNSNFSFSMMGSEMLAQSSESVTAKSMGSAVLVGGQDQMFIDDATHRGWDWRSRFEPYVKGSDVLQFLRQNIAEELSMASLEEGFS